MASNSTSTARAPADPLLVPQGDRLGKNPLKILKTVVVVGCEEHCHLLLKSSTISRHHALMVRDKNGVYVRDLGSRTKVVVNGQPQREAHLEEGDEIHFGRFSFKYSTPSSHPPSENGVAPAQIFVNGKPQPNPFTSRTLLIGRGEECDINVASEYVSSRHAVIFTADGKRYLRDLDSRTGTFVNNKEIHQQEIKFGDELKIGPVKITLAKLTAAQAPAEPVAAPASAPAAPAVVEEPIHIESEPERLELGPAPDAEHPAEPIPLEEPSEKESPAEEPVVQATVSALPEEPAIDLSHEGSAPESEPIELVSAEPATKNAESAVTLERDTPTPESPIDLSTDPLSFDTEPETDPEPESAESPTPIDLAPATQAGAPASVEPNVSHKPEIISDGKTVDLSLKEFESQPQDDAESTTAPDETPVPRTPAAESPKAETPIAETTEPIVSIAKPAIDLTAESLSFDIESDIAKEIDVAPAPAIAETHAQEPAPAPIKAAQVGPVRAELGYVPPPLEEPVAAIPSSAPEPVPHDEPVPVEPSPATIEPIDDLPTLAVAPEPDIALNILEPALAEFEHPVEALPIASEPPQEDQPVAINRVPERLPVDTIPEPAAPEMAPITEPVDVEPLNVEPLSVEAVSPEPPPVIVDRVEEPKVIDLAPEEIATAPVPELLPQIDEKTPREPRPSEPIVAAPKLAEPDLAEPVITEPQIAEPELVEPQDLEPAQSPVAVDYSAPPLVAGITIPALDLTDAPTVAEPTLEPEPISPVLEHQDERPLPIDVEPPLPQPVDFLTPPLPDTSDVEPSEPPIALDLDLADAPVVSPLVEPAEVFPEPGPEIAETERPSQSEQPDVSAVAELAAAAEIPVDPEAPAEPSKRRIRRPRAAPPPPPPKPKKTSRGRVKRTPPAIEATATELPAAEPAEAPMEIQPAEAAEPVLDQLGVDVPPPSAEEIAATAPSDVASEQPPVISIAEVPAPPNEFTVPMDIAPPDIEPVDIAPPVEITAPVDAVPPIEISPPAEISPPVDLAPPDEAPLVETSLDDAPPVEMPLVAPLPIDDAAAPLATDDAAQDNWQAPPASEEEISPPYVPEEPVTTVSIAPPPELHAPDPESIAPAPELVATSPDQVEPTPESIASPTFRPPGVSAGPAPGQPPPAEAPMSSLGGMGTVNLDHFLGGLPTTSYGAPPLIENPSFIIGGGIPVELPPLPQTPEWFGKIKFDFESAPRPAPPLRPPPPKLTEPISFLDDEPIIQGKLTIDESPAAVPVEPEVSEEPEAPPITETPHVAEVPPTQEPPPPSPVAIPAMPKPAAPPPKITAAPSPAKPKIKTPPPSFMPRPRRAPFSTEAHEIGESDLPLDQSIPLGPTSGSMPFDGLAIPAIREADVFSNIDANALHMNDAVFGGARLARPDDIHIPESPGSAERRAEDLDHDFAEDDFWNRTDEEDDLAVKPKEPPPGRPSPPIPPAPAQENRAPEKRPAEIRDTENRAPENRATENRPAEIRGTTIRPPEPEPAPAPEPETEPEPVADAGSQPESEAEAQVAENDNPSEPPPADISHEPATADDMNHGDRQNIAVAELAAPDGHVPPPRKRRRFRIPFLMPLLLIGIIGSLAAVWYLMPLSSEVVGTLSFLNFNWTPGTQESIEMEAAQRRYLQDVVRPLALDNLRQIFPGTSAGFLNVQDLYSQAISSVDFSGTDQTNPPRTYLTLRYKGADKDGDRLRMLALLQAVAQANAPLLDGNHRLRDAAQKSQRLVDDNQKKVDDIKSDLTQVQALVDAQPTLEDLSNLTSRKTDLERAKVDAEQTLARDQSQLALLQKWIPAGISTASAATQPDINDPQLNQMTQQLADLSAEADSARSDQVTAAVLARQQLENAAKQFNDQITSANEALGTGSQLRQFVDSAMNTQSKARDLINMLIVDGEDLENQLEDTRRQVDDLIEARQAQVWASDDQLHQLRDKLQSAQHRYNANVGQGVTDLRILDPIQREIDTTTAQAKERQSELGVDPSEIKVQESINHVILSLRNKLTKEKQQIDAALDPLEKQLSDLDPTVSALPEAQQELARLIRQRLQDLNNARTKYAKTVGDEEISPSAKVADLQTRIADLKSRVAARKTELATAQAASRDTQHQKDLATAQAKVDSDQKALEAATKDLETAAAAYEDARGRHATAMTAQQKKIALLDDQRAAFTDLETARRDRDEKQSAADHAFDIAAVTDDDVRVITPQDPRMIYSVGITGGGLIAIAFLAFLSHSSKKTLTAEDSDSLDLNLDTPPHGMLP